MPLRPRRCRGPPQHEQLRRPHAARHIVVEPGAHTARASGNGSQLLARHGQNERVIALGRKSWLFAGSDRGGERAAAMLTLIHTAKLNDVDPQACLADVLARIADHKITDLAALLPWNCQSARLDLAA